LALWAALLVTSCGAPGVDESIANARASLATSDFATAAIHLRNALQADPSNPEVRLLLARLALEAGDATEAIAQLELLRDAAADPAAYAAVLARARLESGDAAGALALLDEHSAAVEDVADAWLVRGDALLGLGSPQNAEVALTRAEAAGASPAAVGLTRARIAFVEGRPGEAQVQVAELLVQNPEYAEAHALSALLAEAAGDRAAAISALERASELYASSGRPLRAAPLVMALVEQSVTDGDLQRAAAEAARLATLVPGSPISEYANALVAYREGRFADAVSASRAALAQAPDEPRFQALLAAAHVGAGNFGQAEQQILEILSRDRANAAALRMLVETRLRQDRPQAALDSFEQFPEAVAGNEIAFVGLRANAMVKLGDVDSAADALRQTPGFTGDPDLTANIALLLTRVRDGGVEAGASYVAELLADRPDDASSHLTAAVHYQLAGETALSTAAYDRALEIAPDSISALSSRALVATQAQDYATAASLFGRAYSVRQDWNLLASWAAARRLAGDAAWAEPVHAWIESRPADLQARFFLAEHYQAAGNDAMALALYEDVLARDPRNIAALNNGAWLALRASRDDALTMARRAADLAPDNGSVLDTLGWVLVQNDLSAEALPHLELATQLLPEVPEIQYHFAVAQAETGDVAAARETLNRLLSGTVPADLRVEAEQLLRSL
jgi:tetratricopeptide (TPR) repeat protein